ncbi:hypothetical protein GCM10025795_07940 [Verticiella sediminum]
MAQRHGGPKKAALHDKVQGLCQFVQRTGRAARRADAAAANPCRVNGLEPAGGRPRNLAWKMLMAV